MNHKDDRTEAIVGIWQVLLRYRWRFIVPAFIVMAAVLAASLALPRKYKAVATFERRTDMVLTEIISKGASNTFQDPRASLATELIGEPAIDELVDQLKPAGDADPGDRIDLQRQDLRTELLRKITVGHDVSSNELDRVRVSFVNEDPDLARTVVNKLVENYIARTTAQMERRLRQSSEFFRAEVQRNQTTISNLENQQLTFEIDHAELLPDNPNNVQSALSEAQAQLATTRAARESAATRVEALGRSLAQTSSTSPSVVKGRNPEVDQLESELRKLQVQLAHYLGVLQMTARHPDVIALREQIANLNKRIAQMPRQVVTETRIDANPKHAELELLVTSAQADVESLMKQETALEARITGLQERAASLFPTRSEYRKLSRRVEEAGRQLTFWEGNLRRVEIALAAENGDRGVQLAFIKPAGELHKPVSPDLVQVIMAAMVLGLVSGAVCVFFAYRSDETIRDAEELSQSFDLPLLGTVSEIISRHQKRMRRLRNLVLYPMNAAAMAVVLVALGGALYLNLEKPYLLEQLRSNPGRFIQQHLPLSDAQPKAASPLQGQDGPARLESLTDAPESDDV